MKMKYSSEDRSREIGWMLANAIRHEQHFFIGVFQSVRRRAQNENWFKPHAYVLGFIDVVTDYGRKPRRVAK